MNKPTEYIKREDAQNEMFPALLGGKPCFVLTDKGLHAIPAADVVERSKLNGRDVPMMATRQIATERTKNPSGGGIFGVGTTIWFCPKCGTFNTPTHKYCWECGQALTYDLGVERKDGDAHA